MKTIFITITGLILASVSLTAIAQETEKTRAIQVSFVPGFGTNGNSNQYVNHFSLNILSGIQYGLKGAEIGGISNWNKDFTYGAQIGGIFNYSGGMTKGVQLAGINNISKKKVSGIQIAGISNIGEGFNGGQISGISNLSLGTGTGLQLTGISNVNKSSLTGVQIVGVSNVAKDVKGLQLSGINNMARDLHGVQISGVANYARVLRGVQFGLINISDSVASGLPIGLINIVRKGGKFQFGIEHGDVMPLRATFRSGMRFFYTVLSASTQFEGEELWAAGVGLGTEFTLKKNIFMNVEANSHWLQDRNQVETNSYNILNKLNLNVGYQFFKHLSITAGPALNIYVAEKNQNGDGYGYDIAKNPFYEKSNSSYSVQMWIGYQAAINF